MVVTRQLRIPIELRAEVIHHNLRQKCLELDTGQKECENLGYVHYRTIEPLAGNAPAVRLVLEITLNSQEVRRIFQAALRRTHAS